MEITIKLPDALADAILAANVTAISTTQRLVQQQMIAKGILQAKKAEDTKESRTDLEVVTQQLTDMLINNYKAAMNLQAKAKIEADINMALSQLQS